MKFRVIISRTGGLGILMTANLGFGPDTKDFDSYNAAERYMCDTLKEKGSEYSGHIDVFFSKEDKAND